MYLIICPPGGILYVGKETGQKAKTASAGLDCWSECSIWRTLSEQHSLIQSHDSTLRELSACKAETNGRLAEMS